MGMSAAQARLLSVTARLTDNELRSQILTNSKLRLADKSSEASEKYMNALNTQKLVYTNYDGAGNNVSQALTAGTLLSFGDMKNQYAMVNSSGQIYMSSDEIKTYESCATLTEYLHAHGVGDVENELYNDKLKSIYGSNFANYKDVTTSTLDSIGAEINKLNSETLSESDYNTIFANIDGLMSGAAMGVGESSTSYGQFYAAAVTNRLAYAPNPDSRFGLPEITDVATINSVGSLLISNISDIHSINPRNDSDYEVICYVLSNYASGKSSGIPNVTIEGVNWGNKGSSALGTPILTSAQRTAQRFLDILYNEDYAEFDCVKKLQGLILEVWAASLMNYISGLTDYVTGSKGGFDKFTFDSNNRIGYIEQNGITIEVPEDVMFAYDSHHLKESKCLLSRSELDAKWAEITNSIQNLGTNMQAEYNNQRPEYENFRKYVSKLQNAFNIYKADIENLPVNMVVDTTDSRYQWYKNLWYRMGGLSESEKQENGKCYKELDSSLMNNSEWIQFALEHGMITLEQAKFNENGSDKYPGMGTYDWSSIIYSSASDIVSQEDQVAIAKAEVEYENTVREIQNEDKKLDQDLKKLDTQHSALQTEYESIKSVIDKNVERSFKAFS